MAGAKQFALAVEKLAQRISPRQVEKLAKLPGAPAHVEGPVPQVAKAAEDYASKAGIDLKRQPSYAEADPRRGRYLAKAYEKMQHAPDDPKVRASYEALASDTMAQWKALQDAGAKIEFLKPGAADPYPGGPRDALADLRGNNHLFVFPSEAGFGSGEKIADNPLLRSTGINHGGHDMLVNDAFRAVHDYFGHGMEGANFGARGEENAWRAHKSLFSPEALPALTSETRGQNSWVNFGPHGEANRANPRETVFADQKTGLMPSWATKEGGMPLSYRAQQAALPVALAAGASAGSTPEEGESYDPAAPEPKAKPTYPVKPMGEITGTDDTLRDTLTQALARPLESVAGLSGRGANSMASKLATIAELYPPVGVATSGSDTYDAYKRGDKSDMALGALFTGLNALGLKPAVAALKEAKPVAEAAAGSLRGGSFPWGEFDPFKFKGGS